MDQTSKCAVCGHPLVRGFCDGVNEFYDPRWNRHLDSWLQMVFDPSKDPNTEISKRPIVAHRIGNRCSYCNSLIDDSDDMCTQGHTLGEIVGYYCVKCKVSYSLPPDGRCQCGFREIDVPLVRKRKK